MRIFLIGYMGSGKSTFGPQLAKAMDILFYDLDIEFESRFKISIHDFFRKYGEKYFREIENNLLSEIAEQDDFVLATGGGTPCYHQNMELMNHKGITLYLNVPIETLLKRLKESPRKRPVLKPFCGQENDQQLKEHLSIREPFYKQAHIILDGNSMNPAEVASQIRHQLLHLNGA